MKYINATQVLPDELIKEINKYVEGQYIYIPKKDSLRKPWGYETNSRQEILIRNRNIYEHYLIGMSYDDIGNMYHLSEKSIRRIVLEEKRKGVKKMTEVKEILKYYKIDGEPKQIYLSAWDIDDKYVVKKYTNINELTRNLNIVNALKDEGIPVQTVLCADDGNQFVKKGDEYYIVATKLKGSNIVFVDKLPDEWFSKMGQVLARLHKAFDGCEDKINYWNNSLLGEMESWIIDNITKRKPDYLEVEEVEETIAELRKVDDKLSRGIIHRDVHLGNFLFHNNEFSGYIDFDLSQKNIRIFDLCYFMLGLLLEEEENKIEKDRWFSVLRYLINGYQTEIKLNEDEIKAIPIVMQSIELLFVAYFIGENDENAARESALLYSFCKDNTEAINKSLVKNYR